MQNQFVLSPFSLDEPFDAAERLARPEWIINKPALQGEQQLARISAVHRPLADIVADTARAGRRPVSLAGDCCAAIAVLAGLQRAKVNPTLLWLDAHGDFNTRETSPSGFIGGMPLAMIAGRGDQTLVQAVALTPRFPSGKFSWLLRAISTPKNGQLCGSRRCNTLSSYLRCRACSRRIGRSMCTWTSTCSMRKKRRRCCTR